MGSLRRSAERLAAGERALGPLATVVILLATVVAMLALLRTGLGTAGASNISYGYDAGTSHASVGTCQHDSRAIDQGRSSPLRVEACLGGGYDDVTNLARTKARQVGYGFAPQSVPIGGRGAPRFVSAREGIIDTAAPGLRTQIGDVVDSTRTAGSPPLGVRQGGLPGKPGVYGNKGGQLPQQPTGYYRESDVWPTTGGPLGTERLVVGNGGEAWYTPDHYGTFRSL